MSAIVGTSASIATAVLGLVLFFILALRDATELYPPFGSMWLRGATTTAFIAGFVWQSQTFGLKLWLSRSRRL
jgi:hypothetical protein